MAECYSAIYYFGSIVDGNTVVKKQQSRTILTLSIFIFCFSPILAQAAGFATVLSPFEGVQGGADVVDAIRNIVNAFLVLVALIAVITIIFGSIIAATSGDDEDRTARAKNNILLLY